MNEDLNELSSEVIGAAIAVHRRLGAGLFESVYQKCLEIELKHLGIYTEKEVPVNISYRGEKVSDLGFRIDLLIEKRLILELKSVERLKEVHKKQLLTYLKLTNAPLGLLINFNEVLLRDGIVRVINSK
jgi:GxxExxY protein